MARPADFDPVIAAMAPLASALGNTVEIGLVADDVGRRFQRCARFRRDPVRRAGTKANNGKRTGHRRLPWPGIKMSEKYGAGPFGLSASGITISFSIVPRST